MVVCPIVQTKLEEVNELPNTSRGSGGLGSTELNKSDYEISNNDFKRFAKQVILKKLDLLVRRNFLLKFL